MANPRLIKGTIKEVIVLKEGIAGQNFNGGHYDEIKYVLLGEDGKTYVSFWSSSDFDYCSLYGYYTDCSNCSWWWERWIDCEECERPNCIGCIHEFYPCQNPDLVLVETEKWIFRARLLEE